jgi:hypothetical protein
MDQIVDFYQIFSELKPRLESLLDTTNNNSINDILEKLMKAEETNGPAFRQCIQR